MDVQQGKAWYSQIQVKAHEAVMAANDGNPQLTKGAVRKAAREIWDEVQPGVPFEAWWNEVHGIGTAPSNGATKPNSDAFLNRYRDMARKYPTLPLDPVLREMWGAADGILSSIRSRLKAEGVAFEEIAAAGLSPSAPNRPSLRPCCSPNSHCPPRTMTSSPVWTQSSPCFAVWALPWPADR